MLRQFIAILIISILTEEGTCLAQEEQYMPYPIIFVSGIKTQVSPDVLLKQSHREGSPSLDWPKTLIFKELKKYFLTEDGGTKKYYDNGDISEKGGNDIGEVSHLEFFFYDARQDTLAVNANLLRNEIEEKLLASNRYYKRGITYTNPCPTPKVIIIAHSFGGLITRYMLATYPEMQNKVEAVFFLGVPQEGSPLTSMAYFLPKEIPCMVTDIEKLEAIVDSSTWAGRRAVKNLIEREKSKIGGNLKFMKWAEGKEAEGLYTSTRDEADNAMLTQSLIGSAEWMRLLGELQEGITEKGVVKGALIPYMSANSYQHTFTAYAFNGPMATGTGYKVMRSVPESNPLSYELNESHIYQLDTEFPNVNKVHSIVGNRHEAIQRMLYGKINSTMGWDNFYSLDYSCIRNGFYDDGDGISDIESQSAVGNAENIHIIAATHSDTGPLVGELSHPETVSIIIDAIDAPPIVKNIHVLGADTRKNGTELPVYVIARAEDYFLADIEISQIFLDTAMLPLEYLDMFDGIKAKPYYVFEGDFVKKRADSILRDKDNNPVTLYPGEFYVRVDTHGDNPHAVRLKMKNPAGKESEEKTFIFQRPLINGETPTGTIPETKPTIRARIHSPRGTDIDPESLQMHLDGILVQHAPSDNGFDVTMSYTPRHNLAAGAHRVTVNGWDVDCLPAMEKEWTFTVEPDEDGPGYFIVEVPPKISIDTNFTMKVTACTATGAIMDGQDGRPLYNESADITISGEPSPQGELVITHINAGEWDYGVWQITNQRYTDSSESQYRLIITVSDAGGEHSEMEGEDYAIVDPLQLVLEEVGLWEIDSDTGAWQPLSYVEQEESGYLNGGSWLYEGNYYPESCGYSMYADMPPSFLYKIEIPAGADIDTVDIVLSTSFASVSRAFEFWLKNEDGVIPDMPPDVNPVIRVDYSLVPPQGAASPAGEKTLLENQMAYSGEGHYFEEQRYDRPTLAEPYFWGWSQLHWYCYPATQVVSIPIETPDVTTVWVSIYCANIQGIKETIEDAANATLIRPEDYYYFWDIDIRSMYHVDGIFGYKD